MPNLLINATPCGTGGAVQVATGFIRQALTEARARGWKLTLAVAPPVARAVEAEAAAAGVTLQVFPVGPGSALAGRATRRGVRELAVDTGADLVFTVFGPSYVRFPMPEVMGFADGFAITPLPGCYGNHALVAALLARFKSTVKLPALHTAQRYWVETETAKQGLVRRARVAPAAVTVIPNGVNALFAEALTGAAPSAAGEILVLGAGYPHKNLRLIPPTAAALNGRLPSRSWRFAVTLPEDSAAWKELSVAMNRLGLADRCVNLGVLNLGECARAYEAATVVFHPSLLEIFSATYVEAMAARRPLLASDRPFAREICGDAALYFDPLNPAAAAETIARLLTHPEERIALVEAGVRRLTSFPDAAAKNHRLCDWLDECITSRSQ